jgi:hypothetical protein
MKRIIVLLVVAAVVVVVMGFSALSATAQNGMDNSGWGNQSGYCNSWQKDWHQNDNGWWWFWWYRWCWSPQWDWYQDWGSWDWG